MVKNKILYVFFVILIEIFIFPVFSKTNRKTEFQNAISKNDSKKVEKLIKKSSEKERVDGLITAVSSGKIDFVFQFLDFGLDVNSIDSNYNSPLTTACTLQENYEIVKLLLEKGANINFKNAHSETATNIVCKNSDNEDVLNLLIKYGADVNYIEPSSKKTLLMIAIENSNITNAKILIKNGANINAKNDNDDTPLIYAVKIKSADMVSFLIKSCANVNEKNKNNETALYYAILNNDVEITNELLTNKATISINGDKGETLAELAQKNNNDAILSLLKNYGYVQSPTELWNGFTDQMTKKQVIARADKLLNAKSEEIKSWSYTIGSRVAPKVFSNRTELNDFPVPNFAIGYLSPNKEFSNDLEWGDDANVQFYFYRDKLYAIKIIWNERLSNEVIQKAISNYGNNYETVIERDSQNVKQFFSKTYFTLNFQMKTLIWNIQNKEVFIKRTLEANQGVGNKIELYCFSKPLIQKYKSDLKAEEERKQKQVEEERRRTSEQIKF